jgi:endoglucanase
VGNATADHNSWEAPESWREPRPAYKVTQSRPGSDIAGETAAAFAAASILFQGVDDGYSQNLINRAKQLYQFAKTFQGKYSDSVPEATPFYT